MSNALCLGGLGWSSVARTGVAVLGLAYTASACTTRTTTVNGIAPADGEHQSISEFNLGLDAVNHGDFREALSHALRAVQLDNQNARATYLVAVVYLSFCNGLRGFSDPDCRLPDAEKYARKTVKLAPSYPDAKTLLGNVLINEQHYTEAIDVLRPLTTDPSYASIHLAWGNLGWAQVKSGDLEGGIASLKNSITDPQFCVGYYRLGIAYELKGDLAQADTNLTSAVDVESCKNFQDAFEERGIVRAKLGQAMPARADFQRCKDINADNEAGKRCAQDLVAPSGGQAGGAKP